MRRDAPVARPAATRAVEAALLTRAEFQARLFPHGRGWRAMLQWPSPRQALGYALALALGIGPLVLVMPMVEWVARAAPQLPLPWWWAFPPCWGLMLLGLWVLRRTTVTSLRAQGLTCAACDAPFLDLQPPLGGAARHELVMATGRCPRCGVRVVREDA